MTFADVTTARKLDTGLYAYDVPDGWSQGPGAFGGVVVGLLARTALDFESDSSRPLRALQAQVLSPVTPGAAELHVRLLRRGSGLSSVNVHLYQRDQLAATADVVLAKARAEDAAWTELQPPAPPPYESVPESGLPPAGVRPEFTQHFEYRGLPPRVFGAAARSGANGWVRAREPGPRCDAPLVVALIDAWWPAAFARMSTPRPMTTLSFTFQLFIDPSTLDPSQPLVYRASNPLAHDGYTLELRELWTADGRAVAQNQQTFVVLK